MSDPDERTYNVLTALLAAGAALACELYGGLSWLARWRKVTLSTLDML